MNNKRRMAAAISAVINYIRTEEETACNQPAVGLNQAAYLSVPVQFKLWAMSGRQAQMQIRNLMQMKSFHTLKRRNT